FIRIMKFKTLFFFPFWMVRASSKMKITFLTFHDTICVGVRFLRAVAEEQGAETTFVTLREQTFSLHPRKNYSKIAYETWAGGYVARSDTDVLPTDKEIRLTGDLIGMLDPDLLCISTRSYGLPMAEMIVRRAKWNFPILAGGWGPMMEPEKALKWAEHVGFGEGEQLIKLVSAFGKVEDGFRNLIYREWDKIIRNPSFRPLGEGQLNSLPFPLWNENEYVIKNDRVYKGGLFEGKTYRLLAGRGCPVGCSYCMGGQLKRLYKENYNEVMSPLRVMGVDRVLAEIKHHIGKHPETKVIRFIDELFPVKELWLDEFIEKYPKEIGDVEFDGYVRPEFHSEEHVDKLIGIGLKHCHLGIQSGSEQTRKDLYKRKHFSTSALKDFVEKLVRNGVETKYTLMSDTPLETEDSLIETL
ncbi:hypothetical protein LCGC14_2791960, partial [marine sediment metagenome]